MSIPAAAPSPSQAQVPKEEKEQQQHEQQQQQEKRKAQEMREFLAKRMQNGEAVLFHVGKLGKDYQDWVHTTRCNKMLRFVENEYLELTTFCPWYTVPIYWIPFGVYWLSLTPYGLRDTLYYYLMGVALWPALEYSLHRFVFHMHTETYWWNTLHFILHGVHHVNPNDKFRLVFPPVPASMIASILYNIILACIPPGIAFNLMPGLLTGYICYDMVHYSLHSNNLPPWWAAMLRELKIHHYQHHRSVYSAFGITTTSIDSILGTEEVIEKENHD